jgi:hypothetical protein
MSLSRKKKVGRKKRVESVGLKPSEYLKRYGVELPPDTARYIDKYGSIEDGEIDIPGEDKMVELLDIEVKGFMHASDGDPYIGRELEKAIHDFLFNGDPRYVVSLIQINPEITDEEPEVYEYVFTVYDKKTDKYILKAYATVYIYPIKRGKYGETVYGEGVAQRITLKPIK